MCTLHHVTIRHLDVPAAAPTDFKNAGEYLAARLFGNAPFQKLRATKVGGVG